ncbi:MAG: DUF2851 family protein [Bacteroidota bacterium]
MLARNFGMKVNSDAFEAIARSTPINVLAKQKHQIHQLEALLLGQGGLLAEKFTDDYPQLLQKEYQFQQSKHGIYPVPVSTSFSQDASRELSNYPVGPVGYARSWISAFVF